MNKETENTNGGNEMLGGTYWSNRYDTADTGWDLGQVSPPIKAYIDQLEHKNLQILIPGCGNTYEAEYLLQQGFTNVSVIDIAPTLVASLQEKFKGNAHIKIILGDFFEHKGEYDLILEQTFFCAIDPSLRSAYVSKMNELLAEKGKIAGVLFDTVFDKQGPPFGGSKEAYRPMFENFFKLTTFDPCYNSFEKRSGTELFVILCKR